MIEIEIDGQKLQAQEGASVIEVADKAGIPIPRFCYHKKLSVAANCRMCLVDVEKAPKPLPACATPITPGMIVRTKSPRAIEAQKSVMEFLLINHPLDCPICDQGGQCELQDVAMGYGGDVSRFTEGKRSVADENLGTLVATEMTRCIHCTRCVRFGAEIAGLRELGTTGRGEATVIGTYIQNELVSELSGNVIDLCPVGALTAKPSRFKARPWELEEHESIAAHDCLGSNINVHTRRNQVIKTVPQENEQINESWLSDRDRFSYEGLYSDDRLTAPMIKENGEWKTVDWKTALCFAAEQLQKVQTESGAQQIAAVASPSSTNEEFYLLQKMMRGLGSHNIDHRLRQTDFAGQKAMPEFPGLPCSPAELEQKDFILLLGSDIQREQPLLGHRVRQASLKGAKVASINPIDFAFNFKLSHQLVSSPFDMLLNLAQVAKAVIEAKGADSIELLADITVGNEAKAIAEQLLAAKKAIILLGAIAQNHPQAAVIFALVNLISELTDVQFGFLTEGANSAGAWLAGAVPHRDSGLRSLAKPGLDMRHMFEAQLKAYVLLGVEPGLDCANPAAALTALDKAQFVVSIAAFKDPQALDYADVLLPMAAHTETSGTFVNASGVWQSFKGVCKPLGEARPGWKILRVLGNLLHIDGFEYESSQEVSEELKQLVEQATTQFDNKMVLKGSLPSKKAGVQRISQLPIYRIDPLVRRAQSLQNNIIAEKPAVVINEKLAQTLSCQTGDYLQVKQDGAKVTLPVRVDNRIADDSAYIPSGFMETAQLGAGFGEVTLEKGASA